MEKKIRKMTIPPKQKMEHIDSKTTKNKVKLIKTKCLKCDNDKSMFLK